MTSEISKVYDQTRANIKEIFSIPFRLFNSTYQLVRWAFQLPLQIFHWVAAILLLFRSPKDQSHNDAVMPSTDSTTKKFTFSHIWTVEDFAKYKDTIGQPMLQSAEFSPPVDTPILPKSLETKKFIMQFYPKGNNVQAVDYVSIFLRLADNQRNCTVMFEFSVIDGTKKKRNQTQCIVEINQRTKGWGVAKWIASADLFNREKGYLKDGNLTICCEVSILVVDVPDNGSQITDDEMAASGKAQLSENISNLWKMRDDEFPGDLEIQVSGGKVLSAHKLILASRCPVFGAMFRHKNTKESIENRIHFPDMSAEVCTAFLEYLYTGTVSSLVEQAENLLPVADKYQMDHLKSICGRTLVAQISSETVRKLYNLAEQHNADELRQKALDFIKIQAQESFKNAVSNEKMAIEVNQWLNDLNNRTV